MLNLNFLLAESTTNGGGGGWLYPVMIVGMVAVMIVVMVVTSRKQKKQENEIKEMRDKLQVGDEITTIGGIIGRVVRIKDETCVIETGHDRTKIRILRSAISRVDVRAEDTKD